MMILLLINETKSMAKNRAQYQCSECGATAPKWSGQCGDCHAWNTLVETPPAPRASGGRVPMLGAGPAPAAIQKLDEVEATEQPRLSTGSGEFNRALGGGIVNGSVVLVGGDPGIGKSTLLTQVLSALAESQGVKTLYVSGEESVEQISLRSARLGLSSARLFVLAETQLENIFAAAVSHDPQVLVIDSVQTVFTEVLQSAPGAVAQVRECAAQLTRFAKQTGTTVFLVGHVTKEGALAGPRALEHIVDTVLYFEGGGENRYRMIRAVKNRYGAVNELGVFVMTDRGLREVSNPSAIFLTRSGEPAPGAATLVTREGSRPLLVEVQALVDHSYLSPPRRVAVGMDQNRLSMLLAVLHRHAGIATHDQDIYVNVVGGIRLTETAADLAVLMAALSSLRNRPLPGDLIVFGEVGLSGELRPAQEGQERLREAGKHGFKRAIIPAANLPPATGKGKGARGVRSKSSLKVHAVAKLEEAIEAVEW